MYNHCARRCHFQKRLPKSDGEPQTLHPVWDRVPAFLRWDGWERAPRLRGVCWTFPWASQGELTGWLFFSIFYWWFWFYSVLLEQIDQNKTSCHCYNSPPRHKTKTFRLCLKSLSTSTDWNAWQRLYKPASSVHLLINRFSEELFFSFPDNWTVTLLLFIFMYTGHRL